MRRIFTGIALVVGLVCFTACNEPAKQQAPKLRIFKVKITPSAIDNLKITLDAKTPVTDAKNSVWGARIDEQMHMLEISADGYETEWIQIPADPELKNIDLPEVKLKPITMPVILETNPPGAEAFLNNETVGETPVFIKAVPLGEHKIVFKFGDEHKPISDSFTLNKNDYLKRIKKVAISTLGSAVLITDPEALVKVDGREIGTADANGRIEIKEITEGKHMVTVSKKYYVSVSQSFRTERGKETVVEVRKMKMKTCSLIVESEPAGAKVYIDGELQPQDTICKIDGLKPGEVDVKVEMPEFMSKTQTVNLVPSLTKKVSFKLEHNSGGVSFITDPAGCIIYINGKHQGITKKSARNPEVSQLFQVNKLKPGTYTLRVTHEKHEPYDGKFVVEFNKTTNLDPIKLKEKWIADYYLKLRNEPEVLEVKLISRDDKEVVVERIFGKNKKITKFFYGAQEVESLTKK